MQYLIPYHRCYNNPHPQRRVVLDHVSDFISSVSKSLKCGTIRASKFSIGFRLDVFRYLTVKVEPGDQESCMKRMTLTVTTLVKTGGLSWTKMEMAVA